MKVSARVAVLWCAGLGACASARPQAVDFSDTAKSYRSDDYPAVFEAWTRHAKAVQDIGTVIEIWATLKSWDFRQGYIAKYAKVYDLPDGEREGLAKSQHDQGKALYEIHLVAQSTNDRWIDLASRNSPWRITLLDGTGAELAPSAVKQEKLPDIYESEFFPTRTSFSKTYTLRFVRPDGESFVGPVSGRLILRLDSPVAKVEVSWEAKP